MSRNPLPAPRVALLIDGDNHSHAHAGALILKSAHYGTLMIKRVYGNLANVPEWDHAPGFKFVHSGTGRNATDILLTVHAMELMLTARADILIIAASDGDYRHLAQHLTELGHSVIGIGEAKTPDKLRKACTHFIDLTSPPARAPISLTDPLLAQAKALVAAERNGLSITRLSTRMARNNAVQISFTPHKTWRIFLLSHPAHFLCDPKGPTAQVRLKP